MTTKSAFSQAEWELIEASPRWVQIALIAEEQGSGEGYITSKENFKLLSQILSEYKTNNSLIKDVLATKDERKVEKGASFADAKQKLEQIGTLLEQKVGPKEGDEFKEFLLAVGEKVAYASKEGFFNLGDRVSDKEKEILNTVTTLLKADDADKTRRVAETQKRQEAEAQAKREEEARAKREAEAKKKQEAEAQAKREAEARQKQEAEARAKEEAAARARQEAEAKKKQAEAEARAKEAAEAKRQREAEEARQKQEVAARAKQRQAEAQAKQQEEEARRQKEAEEARQRQEAEAQAKREAAEMAAKAKQAAEAAQKEAVIEAHRVYEVQSGDSLSAIALKVYGKAARWPEIFEANKDQIKDPNMIHPGQKLRIPE
jgi:nucleoid-associated protein YgaU